MIIAGYICGILALFVFPPGLGLAGIVIGAINLTRGKLFHGIAQIVIAVTCGAIGAVWGSLVWSGLF